MKREKLFSENKTTVENELPKKLMNDVYWAFGKGVFESEEKFNEAVKNYQIAIKKEDDWKPDEVVFPHASIQICYEYWTADGENEVEEVFELKAADGESFTRSELLFKINNTVAENVSRGDHIFFEGLNLSDRIHDEKPFYWMYLGS